MQRSEVEVLPGNEGIRIGAYAGNLLCFGCRHIVQRLCREIQIGLHFAQAVKLLAVCRRMLCRLYRCITRVCKCAGKANQRQIQAGKQAFHRQAKIQHIPGFEQCKSFRVKTIRANGQFSGMHPSTFLWWYSPNVCGNGDTGKSESGKPIPVKQSGCTSCVSARSVSAAAAIKPAR